MYEFYKWFIAYGDYFQPENKLFTLEHFILSGLNIIMIIIVMLKVDKSEKNVCNVAKIILGLEIFRMIWWFIYRDQSLRIFRFDICNQVCLFMPFIILFKKEKLYPFISACALLGGIGVMIYPLWVFYDYGGIHLMSVQSMFSHGLMILQILLLMKVYKMPKLKEHIKATTIGFIIMIYLAFIANTIRGTNYIGLASPDGIPLLNQIKAPYHVFILVPIIFIGVILVTQVIYFLQNKKINILNN